MKTFFARQHQRPLPWWLAPLLPASAVYAAVAGARMRQFDRHPEASFDPGVPVISVGNLTTGGTGKTPMVMHLARTLLSHRLRVVILSRGYGATARFDYARPTGPEFGDEPWLMQQRLGEAVVIVGADRAANAKRAVADYAPDVILLDDGFQHRRLARQLDIVLVDGTLGLGNGHTLPLGPLREPVAALCRADIILLTKSPNPATLQALTAQLAALGCSTPPPVLSAPFVFGGLRQGMTGEAVAIHALSDAPVVAISGIARPAQFLEGLATAGLRVTTAHDFADHHAYTQGDLQALSGASNPATRYVTTAKDWVKLAPLLAKRPATEQARWLVAETTPDFDAEALLRTYLPDLLPVGFPASEGLA